MGGGAGRGGAQSEGNGKLIPKAKNKYMVTVLGLGDHACVVENRARCPTTAHIL